MLHLARIFSAVLFIACTTQLAFAQTRFTTVTDPTLADQFFVQGSFCTKNSTSGVVNCAQQGFIPSSQFATTSELNAISGPVTNFSESLKETNSKILDFTAAAAALKDAIPNGDDRFAVRLNMGGAADHFAGGFSASANLSDDLRLSVGAARTTSRAVFNAGVNFSFN